MFHVKHLPQPHLCSPVSDWYSTYFSTIHSEWKQNKTGEVRPKVFHVEHFIRSAALKCGIVIDK